jgi:hypothetical protein
MNTMLNQSSPEGAPPAPGASGSAPGSGAGTISAPPRIGAPELSAAEVASARQAWIEAGLPAEQIDAALKADGLDPATAVPPDKDVAQHFADHGLPQNPTAADYHPVWADPAQINPATHNAMRAFAASMGFSPELGNAILGHLSELGAQWRGMNETQKKLWAAENKAISIRQLGGEDAFKEAHDRAAAVLRDLGGKVGSFLANHPVLMSPYLLMTLSGHAKMVADFAANYPEKK